MDISRWCSKAEPPVATEKDFASRQGRRTQYCNWGTTLAPFLGPSASGAESGLVISSRRRRGGD
jgi:hypothetical protein